MTAIDTGIQKSLSDDDPQTLDLIYDAYGDLIFGYINCLVCSRQDAEDCFQNLFIRIVNKRHLLKGKENLKAYLMTMARNEVMEFFRKKKRSIDTVDCDETFIVATDDADTLPVEELSRALASLPLKQRDIIFLKVYQQMTFKEISKHIGISENTVASRYRYGLKKMKQLMLQVQS